MRKWTFWIGSSIGSNRLRDCEKTCLQQSHPIWVIVLIFAAALRASFAAPAVAPGASAKKDSLGAAPAAIVPSAAAPSGCIVEGGGELRARLRGTLDLNLDWKNAEMLCDGGLRPDGSGLRVSIAGPDRGGGKRLRFVFGIAGVREGAAASARPTNLTLVFDGEQRIFSTRGDRNCLTDDLQQTRLGTPGGSERRWRITARGFCLGPAATIAQDARILVSRFDFTAQVLFRDDPPPTPRPAEPARR